jgi:hypothetical protein
MLHEGKTGPAVKLSRFFPDGGDPSLYAVGALAGMKGEVTVIGGQTWLSYGEDGRARIEKPPVPQESAALLVSAKVPAWRVLTFEYAVGSDDLDEMIATLARKAGLEPASARFPFVLEGNFRELEWHVLAGPPPAGADSPADHLSGATQLRLDRASGTILGFYSASDEGVFTHAGSKTHLHVVLPQPLASGHVDHLIVAQGTRVRFPIVARD